MKEINTLAISQHIKQDKAIAADLLVNSTPTVFFDGKKDSIKSIFYFFYC